MLCLGLELKTGGWLSPFVNSGNTMYESFQITDKHNSNQSSLYKDNEHSQNRNNT